MTLDAVRRLCTDCAARFPNPEHAGNLLLGTAAQESNFVYRRQIGFSTGTRGAFGLWQIEQGSMKSSLSLLNRRPEFLAASFAFLVTYPNNLCALLSAYNVATIANVMRYEMGDPMACLFARLHYLRINAPIPADLAGQAAYWKQHYNTKRGKGTPQQYIDNWNQLCCSHGASVDDNHS
jgi:hypothetical protein